MNAFTTYDLDDMINTIVGTRLDLFCVELILDLDQSVLDNFQSLDLWEAMKIQVGAEKFNFAVLNLEYLKLPELNLLLIQLEVFVCLFLSLNNLLIVSLALSFFYHLQPVLSLLMDLSFLAPRVLVHILGLLLIASLVVEVVQFPE